MTKGGKNYNETMSNLYQLNRNLIERIKDIYMFTNDLSYRVIRKLIDKTIYIVNESIDIIRLCYVSIKINKIKNRK